ncbi:sulfurtransferase DndC [Candidatus Magnetoovum chiemensis]|nr:sulfurtransferase DndC [Candidatus Magnetoovum chiemensis]
MELTLLHQTMSYLYENYFADERAWVVAFSGGKDSTLLLQLVYQLLLDNKHKAKKIVYVLSSDTHVEPPNIAEYLRQTLNAIEESAINNNLPIKVRLVKPNIEDRFWAKLIGKGYPSPTYWFRWCTNYMKIKPANREILDITRRHGSVILLLGTRIKESIQRGQRMQSRQYNERGLNPHNEIPNILIASPIAQWSTDEVWEYLFNNNPSPWGINHNFLLNLYRKASGGECPIVLDLNTPSCGGSRFGCWVCTVVKEDKSMDGFIASGEENLRPLFDFRNWLKLIREDPQMRMVIRRNSSKGPGPFTPDARKEILKRLLNTEALTNLQLISDDEIISSYP